MSGAIRVPRKVGELNDGPTNTPAAGNSLVWDGSRYQPASVADKNFVFTQSIPASVWNVPHNLNKYPAVTVTDSAGTHVECEVKYVDLNNLTVNINGSTSGTVVCN